MEEDKVGQAGQVISDPLGALDGYEFSCYVCARNGNKRKQLYFTKEGCNHIFCSLDCFRNYIYGLDDQFQRHESEHKAEM